MRRKRAIGASIPKFYQDKYPQVASAKAGSIQGAVTELQRIYSTTFFPEMKLNWKTHPNNVGHFYYQGCFRCHDGNHVSKDSGKVISKDCNSCHTVLDQEEGGTHLAPLQAQAFKHPVDLGDMTAVNCSDCQLAVESGRKIAGSGDRIPHAIAGTSCRLPELERRCCMPTVASTLLLVLPFCRRKSTICRHRVTHITGPGDKTHGLSGHSNSIVET